jgi:hypothetical protein
MTHRFAAAGLVSHGSGHLGIAVDDQEAGDSSVKFLQEAHVDTDWVKRMYETKFNGKVLQKLKQAVYSAGRGGNRWFSGGGELSARQASTILDYLVLVELLIKYRSDLGQFRNDLYDCRDQLVMQINRYTEGQSDRSTSVVDEIVTRIAAQMSGS